MTLTFFKLSSGQVVSLLSFLQIDPTSIVLVHSFLDGRIKEFTLLERMEDKKEDMLV